MKRGRYTEEQIIGVLREQEAGTTTAEMCRRHGISAAIFFGWAETVEGAGDRVPSTVIDCGLSR